MGESVSAVDVLQQGLDAFPDVVPIAAILIVEVLDPETNQIHLHFRRDSESTAWRHLGMLHTLIADLTKILTEEE